MKTKRQIIEREVATKMKDWTDASTSQWMLEASRG